MKKIRMNAAKLQLGKERITGLTMSRLFGGDNNNNPGGTGKETDSLCNDRCAETWTCKTFQHEDGCLSISAEPGDGPLLSGNCPKPGKSTP